MKYAIVSINGKKYYIPKVGNVVYAGCFLISQGIK